MNIDRSAYQRLLAWKTSQNRKPLLLRGARQVGKTTLVRQFSKEFAHYIELTLEKEADRQIFDRTDDVIELLNAIYLLKQVEVSNNPTLLFVDEIQESPKAIQMLRFLYEEKPDLYVIAAGSLLEFALKDVPSFPVGRIEYLSLHPVNFDEFLGAVNANAGKVLHQVPVVEYAHDILLKLFHEYAIVGGMPEVVKRYVQDKNISALSGIYKELWRAYKDDVEKYARNHTERNVIRHIINTAPKATDRIKFEGFGNSNYRSREVGEALRALDMARIIQLVYPTTSVEPPVMANLRKRPRLQFIDTGMLIQVLLLQGDMIGIKDLSDFFKGRVIQHLVSQEIASLENDSDYRPHFWVRQEKEGNAEVDLVYQYQRYVIPIEIKSGKQGRLKSLHQFVERTNHPYAVRLYGGKFGIEKVKTPGATSYLLMNMPYYLGTKIHEYISYFINNYQL
jgi:predicted AAA+ superfamily ATPase